MKNYIFAKFSRQNNTAGFSLVELIVTMAITGIVLTIGGNGLMVILNSDRQAESKTDLRMELNRAIDFIADDLRESNNISTSVPTIAGSRQVTISLIGQSCLQPGSGNICTNPQILTANTQVFARAE